MDAATKQLQEARKLINKLTRVCRQTITYMDGVSALDQQRLRRLIQEAVHESNRFLGG